MTKKIFLSIITVSFLAVTAAIFLLTGVSYRYAADTSAEHLRQSCTMIASAVEQSGGRYLDETDFGELRVTWISAKGRVIFDSQHDPVQLDDHSDRQEVGEAMRSGEGESARYSDTLMTRTVNHARRLSDGSVIRVSAEQRSFPALLLKNLQPLAVMLTALALCSFGLAILISRHIVRPINNIDLDHPKTEKSYKELAPLLKKLRKQNGRINRQMIELRQSREQFSLTTESMSEGLIVADQKANILTSNTSAYTLLGAEKHDSDHTVFSLCRTEQFRRCIQNAMGGRRSECLISTDGGERKVIASPANSHDTVNGIVVFILDVTEQQQLETMRREFTSNVSHELKTPLTTIYGISDMLANGMVKPEDVPALSGDIRHEADRLITLINDIVSLSKLDEEEGAPRQDEEVDLYELAEDVISRLRMSAEEKHVTAELTGDHVTVLGSRTILDEVIYNLCDNAIKYNNEGGSFSVKVSHIPMKAIVTVSDTGAGIPEAHLGRIFERFYRVDKSRSRKIKGTGLGLSIVKHGVSYHGGTVRVDSTVGKGTAFTVELPIEKRRT
ncbi:MAG: PAS domain S-box protein [Ruminococcus sp.]|nr:PAS domain S-box protein [Ruminococcus sp.]